MNIYIYFLLFIIYSIFGWIIEIITEYIHNKRLINRGFLIGPYCPIYGYGSVLMILLLDKYLDDPIALFVMAVVICSLLEYFTSYIMEKLFNARWWDYSNNKFNINGRICLETMIPFGVCGVILMYFINPPIVKLLKLIPKIFIIIIAIIIFMLFIIDNVISFKIILGFRNTTFRIEQDNTTEITAKVKDVLMNKSILSKRLVKAFPNGKVLSNKRQDK